MLGPILKNNSVYNNSKLILRFNMFGGEDCSHCHCCLDIGTLGNYLYLTAGGEQTMLKTIVYIVANVNGDINTGVNNCQRKCMPCQ